MEFFRRNMTSWNMPGEAVHTAYERNLLNCRLGAKRDFECVQKAL